MPPRLRLFFSALTGVLLLLSGLALYRELSMRSDIWWTPLPMAPSLADSRDRVEIYIRGKPIGALLEARQLSVADEAAPNDLASNVLGAQEIRLRFNNWDRIRAERLPVAIGYGAAFGAGAVLLLLIATGRLAYRDERGPVAA